MTNIYHVSKQGNDTNNGSITAPFLTIQKAASLALPGDRVIVHEGVYREWVKPEFGGNRLSPIVYEAAENEHVIIKGSEQIMCGNAPYQMTFSKDIIPLPYRLPVTGS